MKKVLDIPVIYRWIIRGTPGGFVFDPVYPLLYTGYAQACSEILTAGF